jgi:hypothetical protein
VFFAWCSEINQWGCHLHAVHMVPTGRRITVTWTDHMPVDCHNFYPLLHSLSLNDKWYRSLLIPTAKWVIIPHVSLFSYLCVVMCFFVYYILKSSIIHLYGLTTITVYYSSHLQIHGQAIMVTYLLIIINYFLPSSPLATARILSLAISLFLANLRLSFVWLLYSGCAILYYMLGLNYVFTLSTPYNRHSVP